MTQSSPSSHISCQTIQQVVSNQVMPMPMIDRTTLLYKAATLLLLVDVLRKQKTDNPSIESPARIDTGVDNSTTPTTKTKISTFSLRPMTQIHRVVSGTDFQTMGTATFEMVDHYDSKTSIINPVGTVLTPSNTPSVIISPVPEIKNDDMIQTAMMSVLPLPQCPPLQLPSQSVIPAFPPDRQYHQRQNSNIRTLRKKSTVSLSLLVPYIDVPNENDVLLGKGKCYQNHSGNILFRTLVETYRTKYDDATRKALKTQVAADIVSLIQTSYGGKFLERVVIQTKSQKQPPQQDDMTTKMDTSTISSRGSNDNRNDIVVVDDDDDDHHMDDGEESSECTTTYFAPTTGTLTTITRWVEVDDKRAREKVALCFRSKRRQQKVQQHENEKDGRHHHNHSIRFSSPPLLV
jgi:hypothetical protein